MGDSEFSSTFELFVECQHGEPNSDQLVQRKIAAPICD